MINLREIIDKYKDVPFKLGGWDINEGLDCLSLIYYIYKDLGREVCLDDVGDFTIDNYKDLWYENAIQSTKMKLKFVARMGQEVKSKIMSISDIIIVSVEDDTIMGIYVGQGLFISAFTDIGVALHNIESYKLKRVYRWATKVS